MGEDKRDGGVCVYSAMEGTSRIRSMPLIRQDRSIEAQQQRDLSEPMNRAQPSRRGNHG